MFWFRPTLAISHQLLLPLSVKTRDNYIVVQIIYRLRAIATRQNEKKKHKKTTTTTPNYIVQEIIVFTFKVFPHFLPPTQGQKWNINFEN